MFAPTVKVTSPWLAEFSETRRSCALSTRLGPDGRMDGPIYLLILWNTPAGPRRIVVEIKLQLCGLDQMLTDRLKQTAE